nr:hypothetical protein [Candidatus Sigynarchaeum springense]
MSHNILKKMTRKELERSKDSLHQQIVLDAINQLRYNSYRENMYAFCMKNSDSINYEEFEDKLYIDILEIICSSHGIMLIAD